MGRLPPSVAAGRVAVREALSGVPPRSLALVACSGGADSLALAAATAFVAPRLGLRAGLVSIDHGLQDGSAQRTAEVLESGAKLGLQPLVSVPVQVGEVGGPEAAARTARYAALAQVAVQHGAAVVLLGHTRDDQAETVLLALARGAGPRGLAGMPVSFVRHGATFLRPFLDISRATTVAICAELGLLPWQDPHNADTAYARARVRAALPVLVQALGPDVMDNLARTARLVGADLTALDELADQAAPGVRDSDGALLVTELAALAPAIRGRLLRRYALDLGVPGGALAATHLDALDALVTRWHGQGPVALPGGVQVTRRNGRLQPAVLTD